jgi:predicted HTH domain antitoxin
MTLTLPQNVLGALTPESAAFHLAIGLYVSKEATLGQAAAVAQMTQGGFMRELGKRKIPLNYGPDDLAADLRAVEELSRR